MSKLEKLIQQYCPDGVEYHPLWSLTAWDKKFNGIDKSKQKRVIKYNYLLAADLKSYQVDEGTVKLLTTNISNLYTSEELAGDLASEGEVVAIPWGGNPIVQYYKGRFLTADNRIATSLDTNNLNNKFLYYCMLSQMKLISSFYRGSGIKHPEMAKVLDLEIPVPPLPVQEEIVRVLDTFTELQAELQAELQKRQQQYNFYRDNLLNFKNIDRGGQAEVRWMKLKNVCMKTSNIKWKSTTGQYRYIDLSSVDIQTHSIISTIEIDKMSAPSRAQQIVQEDDVIFATTRPTQMRACIIPTEYNGDICSTGYCILRADRNILLPKFLFFSMTTSTFKIYLSNNLTLGNYPSISNSALMGYEIPVPPIAEQQKIVSILDRFDTLTNDLTSGLPAEMEKRRQQYEFYRDKLLTFKRKEA